MNQSISKRILYTLMALSAIGVGIYPLMFLTIPENQGLLSTKSAELLSKAYYQFGFHTHILLGGVALISGFSQFFPKLRRERLGLHRSLGKIYVIAVMLSGISGLYLAFHATGGWMAISGFSLLAILWLFFTIQAYQSIKNKNIQAHQKWMIRSYALCFGAVTLRIYLPLSMALGFDFMVAYPIIAWLAWVPNLLIAEQLIVRRIKTE